MNKTIRTKKVEKLRIGQTIKIDGSMYYPANLRNQSKGRKYHIRNMGAKKRNGEIIFTWQITRIL